MNKTKVYENIIEITWVFDQLEKSGKIKPWNTLVEELLTGSDAIKEEIIQIAEAFEKEYPEDYDWNAADTEYLTAIQKYAEKRLINEYGKGKEELHCGDIVKMLQFADEKGIPLIGIIRDIDWSIDGEPRYGAKPLFADCIYYFSRDQLEKCRLEFVAEDRTQFVDGVTACCGYDFGVDFSEAKYCPICGKKIIKGE